MVLVAKLMRRLFELEHYSLFTNEVFYNQLWAYLCATKPYLFKLGFFV